jgi:hypothetical protein
MKHPVYSHLARLALATLPLLSGSIVRAAPCVIANEAQAFAILSRDRDTNGRVTLSWESCNEHLYQVQTSEGLAPQAIWMPQALMIGGDLTTTWADTNATGHAQRFYRVQRFSFGGDEDGDGLSNLDEFNRGTDLRNPDTDGDGMPDGWEVAHGFDPLDPKDAPRAAEGLPTTMIVGQTANLRTLGALAADACQWTVVTGRGFLTNTVNCATDFRPSWSGAVTVQVACASAGVVHTNRARTAVAFPTLSPVAYWNQSDVQFYNNCYNFATDIRTDTFAQPGVGGGSPAAYPPFDCQPDTGGAITDGLQPGVDLADLCRTSGLPQGHIVALLIWPGTDFHWARLEADGTWAHKPGSTMATTLDSSGQPITDPRTANFSPYYFCSFFWVGPNVHIR